MTQHASKPIRYDAARYFALAEEGLVAPDERTELLDGIIVAMAPQSPLHAAAVVRVERALRSALGESAVIRVQMPLVAASASVLEPDLAVVAGSESDYIDRHPGTALLVVEVAISTVTQDRLTKAAIYAAAGVRNYWIVQPGKVCVDVYSRVCAEELTYESMTRVSAGGALTLDGVPGVSVRLEDLIPRRLG